MTIMRQNSYLNDSIVESLEPKIYSNIKPQFKKYTLVNSIKN